MIRIGRGHPIYLAPELDWPLTARQHAALVGMCEGGDHASAIEETAEWLGINPTGMRKLINRTLEALDETHLSPACYRLGRFEVKWDALKARKRRNRVRRSAAAVAIEELKAA